MKKTHLIFGSLICLGMMFSSCTKTTTYPSNPKDGEKYVDSNGNNSIWNAALQCWMISSIINGRQVQHNYYPSSNIYTNGNGVVTGRPHSVPAPKSSFSHSSSGSKSSSASFGSTGRGFSAAS